MLQFFIPSGSIDIVMCLKLYLYNGFSLQSIVSEILSAITRPVLERSSPFQSRSKT